MSFTVQLVQSKTKVDYSLEFIAAGLRCCGLLSQRNTFSDQYAVHDPRHWRIQAMGISCYRKILRISYKDHVTNEEVRAKIQQAIRPHEDLLTIVKRRKL